MKKTLSYLMMSLVFFNILFLFYYYFRIVTFLYIDLFSFNKILNCIFINFIVLLIDIMLLTFYKPFKLYKLSYFKMVLLGIFIGVLMSLIILRWNNYEFGDYLSLVSYFLINTLFIIYSLNFEREKLIVFE